MKRAMTKLAMPRLSAITQTWLSHQQIMHDQTDVSR